ncbi:MAG: 4'-phosphopantetheinyl transferase superfamily protein [Betaproteobacteria bacterium]|nr:4'-phosphopantetheinyl transferase superfamily protein [Betaproteobacteria bacterium]
MNKLGTGSDSITQRPQSLPSPAPGIAIWQCDLELSENQIAMLAQCLSAAERQRATRFGMPLLRARYVIGRARLRWVLGRALSIEPQAVMIETGRRGRPFVRGHEVDFNVSHTQAIALIGIVNHGRIGVDIESGNRRVNVEGVGRRFMTLRERGELATLADDDRRRALLRLWTCKEALSKATGDALSAPFRHLEVAVAPAPRLVAGPPPYVPADWQLFDVALNGDYLATVAWWRTETPDPG